MKTLMRIAALAFLAALSIHSCGAQVVKTVVSGTITDANGVPYAGGTIDATLLPTGTTPTVAGIGQIDGYVQPVSIATDGSFTLPLYCNSAGGGCTPISPSSTQWMFTVRNRGASPPVGFGGVSFTITATITGATQSLTTALHAAAPQLLVSAAAGSGPVTGTGTLGFIPKWTSSSALGNSACDDGITTAATFTCSENIATTGSIKTGGGNTAVALAAAGVNTTPVTVNAATNAAQAMQTVSFGSTSINTVGKTFRIHSSGTLAVSAGGSVKTSIGPTPVIAGLSVFTPATTSTYSWSFDGLCTTTVTGATGTVVCSGTEGFGGVAAGAQLDNATYPFFITVSPSNVPAFVSTVMQVQFSTSSTSNTATGDYLSVEFLN